MPYLHCLKNNTLFPDLGKLTLLKLNVCECTCTSTICEKQMTISKNSKFLCVFNKHGVNLVNSTPPPRLKYLCTIHVTKKDKRLHKSSSSLLERMLSLPNNHIPT